MSAEDEQVAEGQEVQESEGGPVEQHLKNILKYSIEDQELKDVTPNSLLTS